MSRRLILWIYSAWMTTLAVIYYLLASGTGAIITWLAIGVSGAAATFIGVRHYRPPRTLAWLLLGIATLLYAAGNLILYLDGTVLVGAAPVGTAAVAIGVLYAGVFLASLIGLLMLGRPAGHGATIDALIVMFGVGLAVWTVSSEPTGMWNSGLTEFDSLLYPLANVMALAAAVRVMGAVAWNVSVTLLVIAVVGRVLSGVAYRLDFSTAPVGEPVSLGWLVFYVCWGAAALHPSMRLLGRPPTARPRPPGASRLLLLALSLIIPPILLIYESAGQQVVADVAVIATVSLVMFGLVLARIADLGGKLRLKINRETNLRRVVARLVTASDRDDIVAALDTGTEQLLPRGTDYRTVLLPPQDTTPAMRALRTEQILPTSTLPQPVARTLDPFPAVLACPLIIPERSVGTSAFGMFLVAAPENALEIIREELAALAAEAALAMDRIYLNSELLRRKNEEYFRALVHNTSDVILILDDADRVRYASPSAAAMFGTAAIIGFPLLALVDERDRQGAATTVAEMRLPDLRAGEADWTVRGPTGPTVQVEATWRDLRDDPAVQGIVLTLRDVTEQRRLEQEMTYRAYHDELTGLPNRALCTERIQQALSHVARSHAVAGVLMIDLDEFKVVNDTLGHKTGDELLVAVSHRLRKQLRQRDTAARLGGDEFAVVIDDASDPEAVDDVANRILEALREPFLLDGQRVNGAASIGVSTTADAHDGPELLRHADIALYVAKGEGKAQYRRYRPGLHTELTDRMALRTELKEAISSGQLVQEYQPIVELDSGAPVGFEALVRWHHPTRGRLMPNAFIDLAEESGLVVLLGEWVLHTAIAAAAQWRRLRPYLRMSVNVSAWQFRRGDFADLVMRELVAADLPPTALMLEITESLIVPDDERVWHDLAALRGAGVQIAIDDFGTGYSSLSYLRQVPLDILKIDRLFTMEMTTSTKQLHLVDGILRLAQTLDLQVVAEGVETQAQLELLAHSGCRYGQGFLFAPPLSFEQATAWLTAQPSILENGEDQARHPAR